MNQCCSRYCNAVAPRNTGISSQLRAKLRDWAVRPERAGCYSRAALSLTDSKTRYILAWQSLHHSVPLAVSLVFLPDFQLHTSSRLFFLALFGARCNNLSVLRRTFRVFHFSAAWMSTKTELRPSELLANARETNGETKPVF